MHFNPYGGPAAQLAADLANFAARGADDEARALVLDRGMTPAPPTADETARILEWGERLLPVFAAAPDDRVDLVNALLATAACRPYISRHDGKPPHLHYASEHADPVSRVRAFTAGGLAHLVCEDPERLGVCAREGCGTAYVDVSRNGRRRYCTARCATRVHVAEHRARRLSA
ncbi:CGNR zinc finger domain-containing protein [Amycolatopsis sp. NPDC059027]|uniref:CGNR zinc finger domain-containing protein n=1 Tax=unclassified Amycolatopsis TaxID=2618356 RepID=UPI003672917E